MTHILALKFPPHKKHQNLLHSQLRFFLRGSLVVCARKEQICIDLTFFSNLILLLHWNEQQFSFGPKHYLMFITHCAAEYVCSRQPPKTAKTFIKFVKNVEFHSHIWITHENCIWMSTNMPGIGPVISEIDLKFVKFWGCQKSFAPFYWLCASR